MKLGEVPLHASAWSNLGFVRCRTFLNTGRTTHLHPVTKSTGTASNPRCRKANIKDLKLAYAVAIGGTAASENGRQHLPSR